MKIIIECPKCAGSGVRVGPRHGKGVGAICVLCDGSGKSLFTFKPFIRRKKRNDITRVFAVDAGKETFVTYEEFLKGKMP